MANFRVCFDYAAEDPRLAISHLLGLVKDPDMQDKPFEWLVIETDTGKEHKVRCTFNELESEARVYLRQVMDDLDGKT